MRAKAEEHGEKESKRNETRNKKRNRESASACEELGYGKWLEEGEGLEEAVVVASNGKGTIVYVERW